MDRSFKLRFLMHVTHPLPIITWFSFYPSFESLLLPPLFRAFRWGTICLSVCRCIVEAFGTHCSRGHADETCITSINSQLYIFCRQPSEDNIFRELTKTRLLYKHGWDQYWVWKESEAIYQKQLSICIETFSFTRNSERNSALRTHSSHTFSDVFQCLIVVF